MLPEARVFYGWRIVGGAFLIYFVGGGLFNTATVFFKALTSEFGWSRGELSGAFSLGFVVAGLSAPIWGRIADRCGPRTSLLPAVLITGILCMLLARIEGIPSLYILYGLFAFGAGGLSLVPIGVLLSNWFVRRRGRAVGIAYTGGGFGMLVLTPVAGVLVTVVGWRASFVLAGWSVLLVLAPLAFWVTDRPEERGLLPDGEGPVSPPPEGPVETPGLTVRSALASRVFWVLALSSLVSQIALAAVYLHQVPLLTDQGLSLEAASMAAGALGGVGILGRLVFGLLAERRSIPALFAGCFLMYAVGIAALWSMPVLGTLSLVLYVVVFGIGIGASWALSPLIVAEVFGVRAMGEIFGLLGIAATLGGALGGTGAGVVFDLTGGYDLVLGASVLLSVAGALLMALVRPAVVRGGGLVR